MEVEQEGTQDFSVRHDGKQYAVPGKSVVSASSQVRSITKRQFCWLMSDDYDTCYMWCSVLNASNVVRIRFGEGAYLYAHFSVEGWPEGNGVLHPIPAAVISKLYERAKAKPCEFGLTFESEDVLDERSKQALDALDCRTIIDCVPDPVRNGWPVVSNEIAWCAFQPVKREAVQFKSLDGKWVAAEVLEVHPDAELSNYTIKYHEGNEPRELKVHADRLRPTIGWGDWYAKNPRLVSTPCEIREAGVNASDRKCAIDLWCMSMSRCRTAVRFCPQGASPPGASSDPRP